MSLHFGAYPMLSTSSSNAIPFLVVTPFLSFFFFFLNDPPPPEIYPLPLPDALPIPGAGDPAHGPAPPGPADRRGPAGPRRARHDAPAAPRHDGGARLGARERAGRESSRGSDARGSCAGLERALAVLAVRHGLLQHQSDRRRIPGAAAVQQLPRDVRMAVRALLDALQRGPAGTVPGVGERRARHRGGPGGGRAPAGERATHPAARRAIHRVRADRDRRRQ